MGDDSVDGTQAAVMCTLCGLTGAAETDIAKPAALATALAWAAHFAAVHPDVKGGASRYIVMTEERSA